MWAKEIEQFSEMKAKYIKAHGEKKKSLEQTITDLKRSIGSWTHHGDSVSGFDWAVEYAEVFRDGGFDIVVANPPYVRMELFKNLKPTLKRNFPLVHAERADLYCYFYARAIELLRRNGMMSFISSNKWFKAAYGANLRQFISESCCITSITDFGELPVFKAATFPMILVAQKLGPHRPVFSYTQVRSLEPPYPQVAEIVAESAAELPRQYITGREWTLSDTSTAAFLEAIEKSSITLNEYAEGKIYRGVVTGLNRAFIIDKAIRDSLVRADKRSASVIKPLVVGDDVRKWQIKDKKRFMLYMHHGIEPRCVPAVIDHLRAFKKELEGRATEQEWYELQQPQEKFIRAFESPKIVFPDIAKESRFTIDESRAFPTNTVYLIPKRDYYLLGVLNSFVMWRYCKERLTVLGDADKGGRLRFFRQFVEKLPIPKATEQEKEKISKLVQKCVASHGVGCEDIERQIDALVTGLYNCSAAAASA
jgi:Eco57I restriction-modification methylase/TaqI-like C-terminal specificity domain